MAYVENEEARLYYDVQGSGEQTVLMVMGLGGSAKSWGTHVPSALAEHMRVVTFDNRGVCRSQSKTRKWSLADMARDAVSLLDALELPRAHLIGTSMGGMIAQVVAAEHPERVDRLVLTSTSFGGPESVPLRGAALEAFTPKPDATREAFLAHAFSVITAPGFAEQNPEATRQYVTNRMEVGEQSLVVQLGAILESDRSELVRSISAPTLVLHGALDELVPVENGEMLAERIPGARFERYDSAGHMLHYEHPEALIESARAFLRAN